MTNSELLAIAVDDARKYSLFYLNKLIKNNADLGKTFEVEGKTLNNAIFIAGHLAVTENYLCLRCTGGEIVRFGWAKLFALGAPVPKVEECPPLEEILATMSAVHDKSLSHIRSLSDSDLENINVGGFKFATDESNRSVILHAVRHESSHAGHLGWLCKLHGIKTI